MAQLKTSNVHGDLHVSGDITQSGSKVYHEGNFNPDSKQDKLTAGTNITISGNTISATDTTYTTGTLAQLQSGTDTAGRLQSAKLLNDWLNGKGYVTTDTKYSAGNGLTLSGTTFSLPVTVSGSGTYVQSVAQNANGITVTLGTPPNTTYSIASLDELNAGTATTARTVSAKNLNDWFNSKNSQGSDWGNIQNKPTTFPPSTHTHPWSQITDVPATATRWPTWDEVSGKPSGNIPPTNHGGVGTYAFVCPSGGMNTLNAGATTAGSGLAFATIVNGGGILQGDTLTGTWRTMGWTLGRSSSTNQALIAVRIY